jgi:hypothetical protein
MKKPLITHACWALAAAAAFIMDRDKERGLPQLPEMLRKDRVPRGSRPLFQVMPPTRGPPVGQ